MPVPLMSNWHRLLTAAGVVTADSRCVARTVCAIAACTSAGFSTAHGSPAVPAGAPGLGVPDALVGPGPRAGLNRAVGPPEQAVSASSAVMVVTIAPVRRRRAPNISTPPLGS